MAATKLDVQVVFVSLLSPHFGPLPRGEEMRYLALLRFVRSFASIRREVTGGGIHLLTSVATGIPT
jgi:hypothetical protein